MRFVLLLLCLLSSGCGTLARFHKAATSVKLPSGTELHQTGDVAQPAQTTVTTTKTEAPIPPGSRITIETPVTLAGGRPQPPASLSTTTTTEHAVAATSFAPSAPPTPSQLADGQAKLWFWIGTFIGTAAAIFGLVRDWNFVMYGGLAVAGSCLFAIFIQAHPLIFVLIGVGIALKFVGPIIWHTKLKPPISSPPPDALTK